MSLDDSREKSHNSRRKLESLVMFHIRFKTKNEAFRESS